MARGKDLAGLAALGALGYMLTRGKGETKASGTPDLPVTPDEPRRRQITDYMATAPQDPREAAIAAANDVRAPVTSGRLSPAAVADNTTDIAMPSQRQQPLRDREAGMSRGAVSKGVRQQQLSTRKLAPTTTQPTSRMSAVDQIPGQNRSGPTGGERVSGSELGRNVSNTLSALAPMGGGVGKVGAELATSGRVQRAYNAAQAERRAAEGMSPAEALAAREAAAQAAREAKTLNPNAWLAGPKGMAENFRKGGKVKKMAKGGTTRSASSRADGAAQRGKTKCKMY